MGFTAFANREIASMRSNFFPREIAERFHDESLWKNSTTKFFSEEKNEYPHCERVAKQSNFASALQLTNRHCEEAAIQTAVPLIIVWIATSLRSSQ